MQEFIQSLLEEEIVAAAGSGWFSGLPERLRQAAEADVGLLGIKERGMNCP